MPEDWLRAKLSRSADQFIPQSSLPSNARGRIRLRRFVALATALSLLVGISAAGVLLASTIGADSHKRNVTDTPEQEDSAQPAAEYEAASFAIRAVINSGLHDLTGTLLDYQGLRGEADGWLVQFHRYECGPPPEDGFELCIERYEPPRGSVQVTISNDSGEWRVQNVSAGIPQDKAEALLSYRDQTADPAINYKYHLFDLIDDGKGLPTIVGQGFWNGPIPGEQYRGVCTLKRRSPSGEVLNENPSEFIPPRKEEDRDDGYFMTGWWASDLTGVEAPCTTWKGDGWRPIGEAEFSVSHPKKDERTAHVEVTTNVIWDDQAWILPVRSWSNRCRALVFGEDQEAVGEGFKELEKPTEGDPPFTRVLNIEFDVDLPRDVILRRASVTCSL